MLLMWYATWVFLQKKGELTKKTLEEVVHEALEKEPFPAMTPRTVIDVIGKTISHRDIIDKSLYFEHPLLHA